MSKKEQNIKNTKLSTNKYNIPLYEPKHILSPEFHGVSNYETGIDDLLSEKKDELNIVYKLSLQDKADTIKDDIKTLNCLYENYHIGMNVFRTSKGGRDKLRV